MYRLEDKKGQGISFNWIFVVVAGAVILLFFAWFIVRYIDLQNTRLDYKVARNIDSTLLSLKASSQFKPLEDFGESFDFEFLCDGISVNKRESIKIYDKIIFSSKNIIDARSLNVWTYGFDAGFFVDNFVYLIDTRQKYVLVYNNNKDFVEEFYDVLPLGLQGQFLVTDFPGAVLVRSPKKRFVLFFEPSSGQLRELKSLGSVVFIEPKKVGEITFYNKNTLEVSSFFGDALVYGGIFSDGFEGYECSRKKAMDKLGTISNIYYTKSKNLAKIQTNPLCNYNTIGNLLSGFASSTKLDNMDFIYKSLELVVSENRKLYELSCEGVF